MSKNYYVSGGFNLICDVCGKKIKAHEAKHRWDGLMVCGADYEQRHPQDLVKVRQDNFTIPFSRPRPVDNFRYVEGLFDTVTTTDEENGLDYLDNLAYYFAEDYVEDLDSFTIEVVWDRTYTDLVTISDNLAITFNTTLTDSVGVSENFTAPNTINRAFADSGTMIDSGGSIVLFDYIDSTYFATNNYVGTTTTF